jgi:hypothetical protein
MMKKINTRRKSLRVKKLTSMRIKWMAMKMMMVRNKIKMKMKLLLKMLIRN